MSARRDETLPGGWVERGRRLALEVKVRRAATAAELRSVAEELGADPEEFAAYWARLERVEECELLGALEEGAREGAMEAAEELARELFGESARVCLDGRSGGWLVLRGSAALEPVYVREAVELATEPETEKAEPGERLYTRRGEAIETLAALARFEDDARAWVADFPRAVAWQACANGYLPALEREEGAE